MDTYIYLERVEPVKDGVFEPGVNRRFTLFAMFETYSVILTNNILIAVFFRQWRSTIDVQVDSSLTGDARTYSFNKIDFDEKK